MDPVKALNIVVNLWSSYVGKSPERAFPFWGSYTTDEGEERVSTRLAREKVEDHLIEIGIQRHFVEDATDRIVSLRDLSGRQDLPLPGHIALELRDLLVRGTL